MGEASGSRDGTRLRRTDIDGVPTFFVEGAQTPFATLFFRVGFVDEPLIKRGWTHLLEHMAMHERDHPNIQCNASVDLTVTAFQVTGDEPDIVTFLADLTSWLKEPRLESLEHERQILQREASQATYGDVAMHLGHRYGAVGPGTVDYRGARAAPRDRGGPQSARAPVLHRRERCPRAERRTAGRADTDPAPWGTSTAARRRRDR